MADEPAAPAAPVAADPTPAPPAPAPAAPTPVAGDGPWAQDLASLFPDDQTARARVDEFLRTRVQPHTTKLEQQAAQAQDAMNLWTAIQEDPTGTYAAITNELYGEEAAQQIMSMMTPYADQQPPPPGTPEPPADPRSSELLEWVEEQRNDQLYSSELARVQAEHPDTPLLVKDAAGDEVDLLAPFVNLADGDMDKAYDFFTQYRAQLAPGTPDPAPADPAPPAMGSDTAGAPGTTPTTKKGQSINDAIDEMMAEDRARRGSAPPVGTV